MSAGRCQLRDRTGYADGGEIEERLLGGAEVSRARRDARQEGPSLILISLDVSWSMPANL